MGVLHFCYALITDLGMHLEAYTLFSLFIVNNLQYTDHGCTEK